MQRGKRLTPQQRQTIVEKLLEATGVNDGLLSQLAREHGVSRQCVHQIKETLYRRRMFYHKGLRAFVGETEEGRCFLVEITTWEQSLRKMVQEEGFTWGDAVEFNLSPWTWSVCIGEPSVRYVETGEAERAAPESV
jgi:transposase-like protein